MTTYPNLTSNWQACAKWISDCGESLPECIKQKLMSNKLKLQEFAECLRDGTVLCSLLQYLEPSLYIHMSQLSHNSSSLKSLSLKNIQLYLDACKREPFNMKENDLFAAEMLYHLNLEPVIASLSLLSNLKSIGSKSKGGFSFNPMEDANADYMHIYQNGQLIDTGY